MLSVHTQPYIQEILADWIPAGIRVYMKREDLIHELVSGNKWRKLNGNIQEACRKGARTIVTFGGAFSNHIFATAAAAQEAGLNAAGIIRGEESSADNFTLSNAQRMGMQLVFVDRNAYRNKQLLENTFKSRWAKPFFIPEGGTNCLGVAGCKGIVSNELCEIDIIAVAAGTGGTAAGIISALPSGKNVLVFNVLKGDFMGGAINGLLDDCGMNHLATWEVIEAHYGGYARITDELISFIHSFYHDHQILLDPVYTGKMMLSLKKMILANKFASGSSICAIHTGGLQGWNGMQERYGIEMPH